MTTAGSIDVVLDHLALAPASPAAGEAGTSLLPALESLLAEAASMHVPVRLALLAPLGDDPPAAQRASLPAAGEITPLTDLEPPAGPGPHVFVAADRVLRARAARDGWDPVAHPELALPALLGQPLAFVRLEGDIDALRDARGVVPYMVERDPGGDWAFALVSPTGLARALDAGIAVDRLALRHAVETCCSPSSTRACAAASSRATRPVQRRWPAGRPCARATAHTPTTPASSTRCSTTCARSAWQEQGYLAVLVSEDFFPNKPGDPAADPNPNYHSSTDAVIDAAYGADITRAVSVAVLELAAG